MYTYEDLSDLAHAKEDRRSRLVSRIRGWLRKERSPRLTVASLLLPTAAFVMGVDRVMRHGGLDLTPLRWALALFAAWPVFVVLLRWRASVEWRRLDLSRVGAEYIRYGEGVEACAASPKTKRQIDYERAFWDGASRGMGQAHGGAGLPMGLLLGAITLGCWTIWKLIHKAPELLADVIIDGDAVPSTPSLATKISSENWFCEALAETYPYFLSLAFAAFVIGISLPFFSMLAAYAHAHPHHSVAFLHFMVSNGLCTV